MAKKWAEFSRTRKQTALAQNLRRDATPAERVLWTKLARSELGGFRFRRQHPVGPYVLDFYCPEIRLCVEVDGDQHGYDRELVRDEARSDYLSERGIEVLRFWNHEVKANLIDVADALLRRANELQQSNEAAARIPSPWKGEG